jgi:hypothetical protein
MVPESTPNQPGGQATLHQPGNGYDTRQPVDSHDNPNVAHQPENTHNENQVPHRPAEINQSDAQQNQSGDQQVGALQSETQAEPVQTERKFVQPSDAIQAEVRERPDHIPTAPPVNSRPLEMPIPEVFKEPPPPEPAPAPVTTSPATTLTPTAPARPSGRWQAFWFAISALTLWMAISVTSLATRQGGLRKMLLAYTDRSGTELFGTNFDIMIGQIGLSVMLVVIPLFILSTIFVDRYRSVHPDLDTTGMKKIAYFFMVLAVVSIIGSLAAEIFMFLTGNVYKENALTIAAPIAEILFGLAYIYWLYTTVSEDRKL